jgi:hypothetical protein
MNNIKEDFINDYMVLLLSESEMCEKYKMCRATLYKTKNLLGLKRIKTTKVNRILGSAFTDTNSIIKKEVIKPVKESKIPVKPEVLYEDPNIKPVYHNQIPEANIEIIQKPDKPTKTNDKSALLQALQLSSDTLNKLNIKKKAKKII